MPSVLFRPPGPQVNLKLPYSRYIDEPHSYMPITHHTIMNNVSMDVSSESDSNGEGEEEPKDMQLHTLNKPKNGSLLLRRLVVSAGWH